MLGFARWLCALAESRDAAGDSFQLGLRAAVALLALVAWPMPAAGQEPSLSKFREYLDQSPLRARLEGQRVGFRASLEAQIAGLASQVKEQVPGLPDAILEEFETEAHAALDEAIEGWSVDDALAKYAQEFERAYTASEIDALLALLRSDPGRKLERTLQSAMLEVTRIQSERHLALQRKLERLVRQLTQRAVEFQRTGK